MEQNPARFVVRLPNGLPGGEGRPTALKVFKYPNAFDFLADLVPVELDTLFSFNSKHLLAGRSIVPLDDDRLARLGKEHEGPAAPPAPAKGSTSPKRSPMRASITRRRQQSQAPLVLGVEVQLAETDVKSLLADLTLPNEKVLQIITDISKGVVILHANKRAHLDIKPSNCVYANGRAMLSDFGACALIDSPRRLEVRRSPTTRIYAAPEAIGAALTDGLIDEPINVPSPRCGAIKRMGRVGTINDMWSLGATIYEIATGVEFFRFLPHATMEAMLNYDDFDETSQAEESMAWITWFITREAGEYKRVAIRARDGSSSSLLPDRDANVSFFFKVLTGGFNAPNSPPVTLRLWDREAAFSLATILAGLLEPDVAARMTGEDLTNSPLLLGSSRFATAALPVPVAKEADTKAARDIIRELLGRLKKEGSDAAQMTTKLFFAFAELVTRAVSVEPSLASAGKVELTLAFEAIAAYLVAIPFEDPHENFPDVAFAWWKSEGREAEEVFTGNVARLAVRIITALKGRLYNPFIYEASESLSEMAYFFPALLFSGSHAFVEELCPQVKALGLKCADFELDEPGAEPKSVLLQDFFEIVVRPQVPAIEEFYKTKMSVSDMGQWFPE
jgi:serine/threonine protein kinase